ARATLRAPAFLGADRATQGEGRTDPAGRKASGDPCHGRRTPRRAVDGEAGAPRRPRAAIPHAHPLRAQRHRAARQAAARAFLLAVAGTAWADATRPSRGAPLRGARSPGGRVALLGPVV